MSAALCFVFCILGGVGGWGVHVRVRACGWVGGVFRAVHFRLYSSKSTQRPLIRRPSPHRSTDWQAQNCHNAAIATPPHPTPQTIPPHTPRRPAPPTHAHNSTHTPPFPPPPFPVRTGRRRRP